MLAEAPFWIGFAAGVVAAILLIALLVWCAKPPSPEPVVASLQRHDSGLYGGTSPSDG